MNDGCHTQEHMQAKNTGMLSRTCICFETTCKMCLTHQLVTWLFAIHTKITRYTMACCQLPYGRVQMLNAGWWHASTAGSSA